MSQSALFCGLQAEAQEQLAMVRQKLAQMVELAAAA